MKMYTDPTRIHPTDPGHVEGNPVFAYLDAFGPDQGRAEEIAERKERYQKGKIGDTDMKNYLVEVLFEFLGPIRERRQGFAKNANLDEILEAGRSKVLPIAQETIAQARKAIKIE